MNVRDDFVAEVVLLDGGCRVKPRHHDINVQEHPPREQQNEIQIAEAQTKLASRQMGTQCQGSHHRDAAEEKGDIAGIKVGQFLVQIDFVIGPLELADHPERATHGEQHPEDVAAPVRRSGIHQQAGVREKRNETLGDVGEACQRLFIVQDEGCERVAAEYQNPDCRNPRNGACREHLTVPCILGAYGPQRWPERYSLAKGLMKDSSSVDTRGRRRDG